MNSTKVQNPRRYYAGLTFNSTYAHTYTQRCVYTAHAPTSASLPRVGPRLYLAFFTPFAPVAEATFDPPVALHVAAVFCWSRNCAKAADDEL